MCNRKDNYTHGITRRRWIVYFLGAKERRSKREKEIKLKPESLAKAEVDEGDWLTSFFHHLDSS